MLMGEYEHSVDAKGRLFVPAKLRSELGKTFVITKGVDGCIDVYPMDAWDRLQQSFAQQTLPKKKARDVSRFLFGNSMEVEPDMLTEPERSAYLSALSAAVSAASVASAAAVLTASTGVSATVSAALAAVSVAAVATLLIAIPVNLAIQKRNIKNESKFKSNFTFKQPLVSSDQISAEFVSKYAKAIEVKSLIEAKALIESSIATADGGSVVSRATRNNMLTPANITPKNIELFKKAPINYDELMAVFSEAKPFIKKLNTDSLFLVPSLSSVVRRHAESFKVITDIKVPEASGEAGSFLATGRNAHPTYLDIEVSYKDPSDLTKLGGGTNTKKSTLGFHVIPRTLKSTEILTTLKEMGDFEDMKVLNGERESQKKLSNVIKFWKKKGTNNEKAVLSSNS